MSKKEKGLRDTDNSVVIAWGRWYKGLNELKVHQTNIGLYDPAISLLGRYPTELAAYAHTKLLCKRL